MCALPVRQEVGLSASLSLPLVQIIEQACHSYVAKKSSEQNQSLQAIGLILADIGEDGGSNTVTAAAASRLTLSTACT